MTIIAYIAIKKNCNLESTEQLRKTEEKRQFAMNNIFNPDNKFFSFMGRVADLMILNLLCIVCCIPVVTAGPAIAAMYYITLKMARNEESYVVKGFFHSFKQNLKQGIVIQIIMLLLGIVLAFDLYFCRMMSGQGAVYRIFSYIFVAALFVYTMLFLWIYPVLAKFFNTTKNLFRNSILMSIRHLPYTILMMVITAAPVLLGIFVAQAFPFMILFYIMLGFATVAYINSRFFVKLFDNYIPEDAGKDTEENGEEKSHRHQHILQPAPDRTAGGRRKGERGRNSLISKPQKKRATGNYLRFTDHTFFY